MFFSSTSVALATLILVYAFRLSKRSTRRSLSVIRGPKSPSFIFGNLLEVFQRPVGEADFAWQRQYGNVVRFKSVFGEDRLVITDLKALQKILNISADKYPKLPNIRVMLRTLGGKGIFWAIDEDHKRHRSIMLPGFGLKECKTFLPIFKEYAGSMSTKWLGVVGVSSGQSAVLDVRDWLSRATLDVIGQAAFGVQFDAIEDGTQPLAKAFKTFLADALGLPPAEQIFLQAASKHIPMGILQWMADHAPISRISRTREAKHAATEFARELLQEKAEALLQGKNNRDIFTLLVKANTDANAKNKLTDDELLAQMLALLMAGHETTANAVSWILLELARNPIVQSRLRDEIRIAEATVQARSDRELTVTDLSAMPYLNAVIKEGLRFHPTVPHINRIATQDDILPLSNPILTVSGDKINEIFIPKGTEIVVSTAAYHRDKDLWGQDAHEFNPDRWLDGEMDETKTTEIGVYANLLAFLSGPRGCLGWRFAIMEMQAFLFELVGKFEFRMTDKAERVLRQPMIVMAPMVDAELSRGIQLPLAISLAPQASGTQPRHTIT